MSVIEDAEQRLTLNMQRSIELKNLDYQDLVAEGGDDSYLEFFNSKLGQTMKVGVSDAVALVNTQL